MPDTERSSIDDIIELYKQGIDVTLIDENLKLTPEQRMAKFVDFMAFLEAVQLAGRQARARS